MKRRPLCRNEIDGEGGERIISRIGGVANRARLPAAAAMEQQLLLPLGISWMAFSIALSFNITLWSKYLLKDEYFVYVGIAYFAWTWHAMSHITQNPSHYLR